MTWTGKYGGNQYNVRLAGHAPLPGFRVIATYDRLNRYKKRLDALPNPDNYIMRKPTPDDIERGAIAPEDMFAFIIGEWVMENERRWFGEAGKK